MPVARIPPVSAAIEPDTAESPRLDSLGADVLRSLGLEAVIEFLETTAYGVCVTGDDHTWVYLNPAGERIIGSTLAELMGRDYLLHFPPHERAVLLALEGIQRDGDTDFYINTVLRPDGDDREMTWSGTVMHAHGEVLAPAIFHETTRVRRAQRHAAELGSAAVRAADAAPTRAEVLTSLVGEAVAESRACAAVLLVEDRYGVLRLAASAGAGPELGPLVEGAGARLADVVADEELDRGRTLYVSDTAAQLLRDPALAAWVPAMAREPWSGAALVGVRQEGRVVGVLCAVLPEGLTAPRESELVLWSSLADQAGVALGAARVRERVSQRSVLSERSRIARDLHDSVNQALFALHARAQVIRRALAADDRGLALEAAEDLELLSRQATAEMRALLSELSTVEPSADLASLLRDLVDVAAGRAGLQVELAVTPVSLPGLPAPVVEHVPRILGEALHNTVKHAAANRVRVLVQVEDGTLTLEVTDDGRGFDAGRPHDGLGQRTMRERAQLLGGALEVRSVPGDGTTVRLSVPITGPPIGPLAGPPAAG